MKLELHFSDKTLERILFLIQEYHEKGVDFLGKTYKISSVSLKFKEEE